MLRAGDLVLLRRLCGYVPRVLGIRILYAPVSVIPPRMGSWWVLVCYQFGNTRRSGRVQFWPVLLFLVSFGQARGMHVIHPVMVVCGLIWHIVLSWVFLPSRWSILPLVCCAFVSVDLLWWWFPSLARVRLPLLLVRLPWHSLLFPCALGPIRPLLLPFLLSL
jgi:hypothetical protein